MLCAASLWAQERDRIPPPRSFPRSSSVEFRENRGQIIDSKGQLRPDILYKGDAGSVALFFSRTHISYVYTDLSPRAWAYIRHDCIPDADHRFPGDSPDGTPNPDSVLQQYYRMDLELVGGNPKAEVTSQNMATDYTNYYLGHCPDGIIGVHAFSKLTYHDIYPNIDMVVSSSATGVKYDFIVHSGGHASDIALRYNAARSVEITPEGSLRVNNALGYLEDGVPYSYIRTKAGTAGAQVRTSYRLTDGIIRFAVENYDTKNDLVIDPTQQWATFYGGSGKENLNGGDPTEVDRGGNSYVTGFTLSNPFPLVGASQTTFGGGTGFGDAFLVKFDPYGNVVFATYYGGAGDEISHGVSSDADGNAFITGHTTCTGMQLPTTVGAYQRNAGGGGREGFVAKFSPTGGLLWATNIGGTDFDDGYAFAVDSSKNVAVELTTGSTSATFPAAGFLNTKTNAGNYDLLVMKFTTAGAPIWGKFIGGNGTEYGYGAASDIHDNILLTGWTNSNNFPTLNAQQPGYVANNDAFVVKLTSAGVVKWSTYYGGSGTENNGFNGTIGYAGMATDYDGNVFITGTTTGNFPTTGGSMMPVQPVAGGTDAFVVKFDTNGVRLWATYFGGGAADYGVGVASNTQGSVLITGITNSAGITTVATGLQTPFQAGLAPATPAASDAFIVKLDRNGVAKWVTYFGGAGIDEGEGISYDPYGSIFIAGHTQSAGAPFALASPHQTANGQAIAQQNNNGGTDAFISAFCDPDPVRIDSSGPTTFCNSDSVILKILYGYLNVKWYKLGVGGQPNVFLGSIDSIIIKESGRFFVRVENAGGCLAGSDTINVTQLPRINPAIQPGPTANLCTGDSIVLSVTPGPFTTYTWKKAGVTVGSSSTYKVLQGGTYQVNIADSRGCTDSALVVVTEFPKPTAVSVTPADTIVICEGESRLLTASGGVGGTITWSTGVGGATLSVFGSGTYYAKSTGGNGCEMVSNKVVVKVNKKPVPKILPLLPVTFCDGDSTVLAATLTPGGPTTPYKTYLWSPGGETTDRVTRKVGGDVTVTVTDSNGCQGTATLTVTVNPVPHPKITYIGDTVICEGDTVSLGVDQAYGGYRWSTGSTESRIKVAKSGAYAVTVATFAGCEGKSDSIHVKVNPAPSATISGPVAVCTNTPGVYSVQAVAGVSYSWQLLGPSGTLVSGDGTPSIVVNWGSAALNKVIVMVRNDANGCKAYDTVSVDVGSILVPNITYSGTTSLCPGDSIVLDAGPGYSKYTWSPGGESSRTITVKTVGSYSVAVENAGGCSGSSKPLDISISTPPKPVITARNGKTALCPGDTAWLDAGADYADYLWSNGYSNRMIPVVRADSFFVSVTDTNGCSGVSEKIYVTVNTPPAPVIAGPNSVCINSADDYAVTGGSSDTYTWKLLIGNGTITSGTGTSQINVKWTTPGTDTIELTQISAATGCVGTTHYAVTVGTTLMPSIAASRTTPFCEGDSVILTAASGYKTYLWDNGAQTQSIAVKQSGTYTVTVTDAGGCSGSGDISVTQKPKVIPTVQPDGMPGLCAGDSLKLEATPGFRHYLWAPTGDTTRTIWVSKAGSYTVVVTDADSCVGVSASVDVTFFPVLATPTIKSVGDSLEAKIDDLDSPQPSGYQWSLNGAPIAGATTRRIFAAVVGSYTVTVVDSNGCKATSLPFTPTSFALAAVELPTVSAAPGEHVMIPLKLTSSQNLDRNNVQNFATKLRFNGTLLVPVDKSYPSVFDGHDRVMTLTGARGANKETGDLLNLEFIAALGDTTVTPLVLETFVWTDTANGFVPVTIVNGEFTLTGICENGGQRLVDVSGAVRLKAARPNPTGSHTEIEYEVVEDGHTQLYLVDMLGKRVMTLVDGQIVAGSYMVGFDASQLESGLYMYVLQTPTQRLARVMEVVK